MLQKEQQREAQRWLFQGNVFSSTKRVLYFQKNLSWVGKASPAFRMGRAPLPWTGLKPLREILLEKRKGAGNEFFQLLWRIRSQAQGKGRGSDGLNELPACQPGERPWPGGRKKPGLQDQMTTGWDPCSVITRCDLVKVPHLRLSSHL